jgi:CubicO group peptidase (beta-lactamase class C family)
MNTLSGKLLSNPTASGSCDPRFDIVRERFNQNLLEGVEAGASLAISIDGKTVLDIWGGTIGEAGSEPWSRDSIVTVFSTTKTIVSICALMLCDAGALDIDAPVARYWPEFGANGKQSVLVRHILGHTSGVAGWEEPMRVEDLYDWEKATSLLAAQAPWWEPGTASGYHSKTYGFLVGELVRRVTGQTMGQFFREALADPLGADFYMGLPPEHDHRVVQVIGPDGYAPSWTYDGTSVATKCSTNPPLPVEATWTEAWRRAELGAMGGIGNARSVALVQSVLANGGTLNGKRFLSEEGCLMALSEQSYGVDLVNRRFVRMGLGYALPSVVVPLVGRSCGWGGWGGSLVIVDFDLRMSFSYVMNRMYYAQITPGTLTGPFGDHRGVGLLQATYSALAAAGNIPSREGA